MHLVYDIYVEVLELKLSVYPSAGGLKKERKKVPYKSVESGTAVTCVS